MYYSAVLLVVLAMTNQVSCLSTSQIASALLYRRTNNPYLKAYSLANLMRPASTSNTNNNNNNDNTDENTQTGNNPAMTRTCPQELDISFYKFCSSSFCYDQQTINSCCMTSYEGNDGTNYQQCRCETSVTCTNGAQSEDQDEGLIPTTTLCPQTEVRALNSVPIQPQDQCQFGEVANLTSINGQTVTCNAVLTRANVNGVTKVTFVTSALCTSVVDELLADPNAGLEMQIGSESFSLNQPFTTVNGPDGIAFIDLPQQNMDVLNALGQCETPACAYDESSMNGLVNLYQCKMVSYGASDPTSFNFDGMRQVDLNENPNGCGSLPDLFDAANTLCFRSTSGEDVFCVGDSGAPIYCRSTVTDEWILIGVVALQTTCGGSSEVKVIPVPV
ncbi:hypothetical protein PoB_003209100 [Plakobranchus ocellatus]|uniref:Peptidase S1 domain-containing protein n=1 Tax=Plakobranchus ocellatus TaxID=259542 RepID=A0AAV4AB73_9GAST|nr:hypothetical protein PoB_003209100 [Plakobranchus ocellatus]